MSRACIGLLECLAQSSLSVQLLEDEPWEALRPTLEKLLEKKDKDKQRAAAELLAGVLAGKYDAQDNGLSAHQDIWLDRFEALAETEARAHLGMVHPADGRRSSQESENRDPLHLDFLPRGTIFTHVSTGKCS